MTDKRDPDENAVEETIDTALTDPDSPDNSRTAPPPQTIDAEPAEPGRDGR